MSPATSFFCDLLKHFANNPETAVAFAALFYAVYEGRLARRHDRMSVRPILGFEICVGVLSPQLVIKLYNHGAGSAIVKSFDVYFDNSKQDAQNPNMWPDIAAKLSLQKIDEGATAGGMSYVAGDRIAPLSSEILFERALTGEESVHTIDLRVADEQLRRIKIELEYESIYEERYSIVYPP